MVVNMTKSKFIASMTIISLLLVLISGCIKSADSEYHITISGNVPAVIYSGTYTVVTSGGLFSGDNSKSTDVQGWGTQEYTVKGKVVSVAVEKEVKDGTLRVEISKDGNVISQSETSDAFGKVSVTTPEGK
jgi:hypothetical protein